MSNKYDVGATIGLDGEKEFRQAITGINSDMKVLASEMKKVSAEFLDNNDSVEALSAKDEVLNKQLDKQKEKVEALKLALENAEKQYGENDTRTDKWKISLNNAQAELSKLSKEVRDNQEAIEGARNPTEDLSEGIDELGESAENAGSQVVGLGDIIKGNLIANVIMEGISTLKDGIKDLASSTVGFAMDSNKALNNLASQTGATKDELSGLEETMNDIYADNFGENIDDVAASMATVRQQTNLSGEELKKMTEQALLLRDTFDMDVGESVRSANMLMEKFGLSSEEAYNLIAQGAQQGLDKNGDLLDSINEYSSYFSGMGLSANDMFNMLKNGAESGTFSVDKLGDAVKELSIRTIDGSNTTIDAYKSLGLSVDDTTKAFAKGGDSAKQALQNVVDALFAVEDPVEKNRIGVELFGTQWEDLGASGIEALTNLKGEISTTSDALNNINNTKYDDINNAMQGLGRQIQVSIAEPLQDKLMPIVQEVIDYVTENGGDIAETAGEVASSVGDLVGWLMNHGSTVIAVIAGIATGFAAWDVIAMIQGIIGAVKAFQLANEGATIAQYAMNLAMNANPIGIVITAITALVAGIGVLWATNEDFRDGVLGVFDSIGGGFSDAWNAISEFVTKTIPDELKKFTGWVKDNWQGLLLLLVNPFAGAFKLVYDNCDEFREFIDGFIGKVKALVIKLFKMMVDEIKDLPDKFADTGKNTVKFLWNGINGLTDWIVKKIVGFGGFVLGGIESGVSDIGNIGLNLVKGFWNGIDNATDWIIGKVKGFGGSVLEGMKDFFGIHSPSTVFRDEVGTYLAQGVGLGFTDEMQQITKDMNNSIPTDFEVNGAYKLSGSASIMDSNLYNAFAAVAMDILLPALKDIGIEISTVEKNGGIFKYIQVEANNFYKRTGLSPFPVA